MGLTEIGFMGLKVGTQLCYDWHLKHGILFCDYFSKNCLWLIVILGFGLYLKICGTFEVVRKQVLDWKK